VFSFILLSTKSVTSFHDGFLHCFCLLGESYEAINQSINQKTGITHAIYHGPEKTAKSCCSVCWTCFRCKGKKRQNYQWFCSEKVLLITDNVTGC